MVVCREARRAAESRVKGLLESLQGGRLPSSTDALPHTPTSASSSTDMAEGFDVENWRLGAAKLALLADWHDKIKLASGCSMVTEIGKETLYVAGE